MSKERPPIGKPKFRKAVMFWGAISNQGTSDLLIICGNIISKEYIEILKAAGQKIRQLNSKNFTFFTNSPQLCKKYVGVDKKSCREKKATKYTIFKKCC